jgi:hypothetical protein
MLLPKQTIHPECHKFNERPDSSPFTYRIIICYFSNRPCTQSITGSLKDQILVHSLTGSPYPTSPTDHSSRMSQVEWKTRCYSIHLLGHHMLLHQQTIHPEYHRLNEIPDSSPFTHRITIYYFPNRQFIQNVTSSMKDQILVHSHTGSSYATSPTDLHREHHRVNEGPEPIPLTYSVIICYFTNRPFIQNITGWMKYQIPVRSITRSSYATPPRNHSPRRSHVEWRTSP